MGYVAGRSPVRLYVPQMYTGLAGLLRGLGDCGTCTDTADDGSCLEYDTSGCGSGTTPALPGAGMTCTASLESECPAGSTWTYSASPFPTTTPSSTDSGSGPIYVMGSSAGCAPGYVIGQVENGGNSPGQCIAAPSGSVGSSSTAGAIASSITSTESLLGKILAPQTQVYNAAGQLIYSGPASGAPVGAGLTTSLTSSNLLLYGGLALAAILVISMMKK